MITKVYNNTNSDRLATGYSLIFGFKNSMRSVQVYYYGGRFFLQKAFNSSSSNG